MTRTTIDRKLSEVIKHLRSSEEITLFVEGKTYQEIGKSKDKTKHWASRHIKNIIISEIYTIPEVKEACDIAFTREADKEIYIDCSAISKHYSRLFVLMGKELYGTLYIHNKNYMTSEVLEKSSAQLLNEVISEEGFPFEISEADEHGHLTRNAFLEKTAVLNTMGVDWIYNNDKNLIIGNPRVSFVLNACGFKRKKNISLWDVYEFYLKEECGRLYLKKNNFLMPKNLMREIAFKLHNFNRLKECIVKLFIMKKESDLGFAVYDFEDTPLSEDELLKKATMIKKRECKNEPSKKV
ncbi:MAG: hypothetical protein IE916_00040 [Epsilonproteobacteria bacterium]|nr:hypothetical protein [Campylobacterota bacterium]